MNMPFSPDRCSLRIADPSDEAAARFIADHPDATLFHRPEWAQAVECATGHRALTLVAEDARGVAALVPLNIVHSPIFGRLLAGSAFGIGGGILLRDDADSRFLFEALEELAQRRSCPTIELRGGAMPEGREGWAIRSDSHANFARDLAENDEAELLAIPRKQRAEVRKGLKNDLTVETGSGPRDREAHYAVYAASVRNLGTPVFPRALFDAMLEAFGEDADILTVRHKGEPVASALTFYHRGTAMPYWGGGVWDARALRANEAMYYRLMGHARERGCTRFDFGRSKTHSGAFAFKKNWGFEPEPLTYASWTAPGHEGRDADPTSDRHGLAIRLWQKLPLPVANRLGPVIANGLG
ncbi:FemAB family XrtA/PEP-CTERM system-associated protein [Pseudoblastomonas halimionae]|uniref:FemAB family PEP-CTERM system-associated protein n=1 Tax=Alteriqipengyuania halimionae TaxID=1926630 RepID=A0A6I4U2Q9_9SPHN|nr:FemAB family XrtA/PEP-CTERM system-associated protein [Alteriqipengyuania halimionae]MXP09225.1 FemAB family PEP-CTERM system-associated protein [Alteriqipengyuania halimionae]